MTGYVVDDLALMSGLTGRGTERDRREMSRLVVDAMDGGPSLDVPAMCLTVVGSARPMIAAHLAELVAGAPPGAIGVCGLRRSRDLDLLRARHGRRGWAMLHAAVHAMATRRPILTADPGRYRGVAVNVMAL